MSMSELICVTNRQLCRRPFLEQLEAVVRERPRAVVLREKDLPEEEYMALAAQVQEICRAYQVPCVLHFFVQAAIRLQAEAIQLPMPLLRQLGAAEKERFAVLGASCHSLEEALEAERLGCTYIVAGHIFPTGCKAGVPPRGLSFLWEICKAVHIPVYAIGGISGENFPQVKGAGAAGGCVMSGLMTCEDVGEFMKGFTEP